MLELEDYIDLDEEEEERILMLEEQEQQSGIGAGSRQQVRVLQKDGTLRTIEVITGQSDGRRTVVRSADLKPGMKVVTGVRAQGE